MPSPAPSPTVRKQCDGRTVGVIITDRCGRVLLGDRADGAGAAPIAGHVYDTRSDPDDAALSEVREEVGLFVTELIKVAVEWRPDRCARGDGPLGAGHHWTLYRALATGRMRVDPGRYTATRWAGPAEVENLAQRSLAFARGQVTDGQWRDRPGLELVWVRWLALTRLLVTVTADELEEIEAVLDEGVRVGAGG